MRLMDVDKFWTDITSEIDDCSDVLEIIERQTIIVTPEEQIFSVTVNMDTMPDEVSK